MGTHIRRQPEGEDGRHLELWNQNYQQYQIHVSQPVSTQFMEV